MYRKLAALVIFAGSWTNLWSSDASKLPHVCVQVLNDAAVQSSIVRAGLEECSRIFRRAGVVIDWTLDPASESHDFVVVITKAVSPEASRNAVGYICSDSSGASAVVIWPRAVALVTRRTFPFEILGRVMAHELGHLMIGQPHHSAFGVMRPSWTLEDLTFGKATSFLFTREEIGEIRANLWRRSSASTPAVNR